MIVAYAVKTKWGCPYFDRAKAQRLLKQCGGLHPRLAVRHFRLPLSAVAAARLKR
jgi:hypothetical protein